jgi:hypothetical protein
MSAAKPAPVPLSVQNKEWLAKPEAAKLLGVQIRALERRCSQGYVEKRIQPRKPTERAARVLYSRADILALKAGTPNVHAREVEKPEYSPGEVVGAAGKPPVSKRLDTAQSVSTALIPPGLRGAPASIVAFWEALYKAATTAPPAPKPWLTLAEAVEYSGLPRGFLLAIAQGGGDFTRRAPPGLVLNVGTEKQARWRFNRELLIPVNSTV